MKRLVSNVLVLMWAVAAFAQGSILKQTLEIAEVEVDDGDVTISVFNMPEEGQNQYCLCVGTLGIGNDVVQYYKGQFWGVAERREALPDDSPEREIVSLGGEEVRCLRVVAPGRWDVAGATAMSDDHMS